MHTATARYYPDQARHARLAAAELGVDFVDLDGGDGYLFELRSGTRRVLAGAGSICSYPVNNASSYTISRDKAYTKAVLAAAGITVIEGRHFFLTEAMARQRNAGHERDDAVRYAESTGFPLFCKPLTGGRGDYAEVVADLDELHDYVARVSTAYLAIVVERLVTGVEHRVVVYDDDALFTVAKSQAHLRGDGSRSVGDLLEELNTELAGTGVSALPPSALAGIPLTDIPDAGVSVPLTGRRNLSAGGGVDRVVTEVPEPLRNLAVACCSALGLRVGAVDVFDVSPTRDLSELVVIEVNGNPTLQAAERAGRLDLVVGLWARMLRECLGV